MLLKNINLKEKNHWGEGWEKEKEREIDSTVYFMPQESKAVKIKSGKTTSRKIKSITTYASSRSK